MRVIVHAPPEGESARALSRVVAGIHAQTVLEIIRRLPCTPEQRASLLDEVKNTYRKQDGH